MSQVFGAITSEYLERLIEHAGETVRLDLNVSAPLPLAPAQVAVVDAVVADLDRHDAAARAAFTAMLADPAAQPVLFWEFHRDEVPEHAGLDRDAFVPALGLVRVGVYVGEATDVVLDYALRGPRTDQLLVAKLDEQGAVRAVSWES